MSRALRASYSNFLFISSYSGCWSTLTRLTLPASSDRLDRQSLGKDCEDCGNGDFTSGRMILFLLQDALELFGKDLKFWTVDKARHGLKSIVCKDLEDYFPSRHSSITNLSFVCIVFHKYDTYVWQLYKKNVFDLFTSYILITLCVRAAWAADNIVCQLTAVEASQRQREALARLSFAE